MERSTGMFPTLGAMSTTTLAVTASVYSSFVTPAITVPFPSFYGTQTQLPFQWTDMPSLNGAQPTQIGGVEATSGVYSIMREFRATAVNPGPMNGGANKADNGFEWPTWATAVIAGCGGAALIALIAGTCCWRRSRKRKQQQREQQKVDHLSKRASAYLSHEQQARDGYLAANPGNDKQSRRKNRKGAQPLSEKAAYTEFDDGNDRNMSTKARNGAAPVAAAAVVGGLAAARSQKPHNKGNRLSKQYTGAHGHGPKNVQPRSGATGASQDYDYPPYPTPPPAVAPSPSSNTPLNSRDVDYRAGTGYRPVAQNASTYSLNNESNQALHQQQQYTPGYGPQGMVYPTDDYGNPIMPGLRGHRRVASDDSGYNTPTTIGVGNDSYSQHGSPARLLGNAAPMSARSRDASGNSEQWTGPDSEDAGMSIGGAMLGRGSGGDDQPRELPPPVPVAMLPPGQRMGTPERKRQHAKPERKAPNPSSAARQQMQHLQQQSAAENGAAPHPYPHGDVRNRRPSQPQQPQDEHLGGLRDSARLSRQPSPTYAVLGAYSDDGPARARSAQSDYHDARSGSAMLDAPGAEQQRSQSAQSLRTGKRFGRKPDPVQVQPYDSSHNVPLSPSMDSPAYASSSGDASSPGYASSDYRDAQQGMPGQAL
ncbi:hypothetical protein OIO90_004812 [Microbotryomycetes sp. JL221]|nr:hypothetical protein OIO90_004812 [Microbotryomycetes sp. JL221]